jgi:hypothetical protein
MADPRGTGFCRRAVSPESKCRFFGSLQKVGEIRRLRSMTWGVAVWLAVVGSAACGPGNRNVLVAYVHADLFSPFPMKAVVWNYGESVICELASLTSIPPDEKGDLLLCGAQTQFAWSQTPLRGDIKSQIYDNAAMFYVTFHGAGRGGGRFHPVSWKCKRLSTGIDCE